MTEYVIQVVSALRVGAASPKTFGHMVTPMAPFLFIAGDLGDPFHVSYAHFLSWASFNWERVVFVAGAEEYAAGHPDCADEVDLQCRLLAARFHNVRFLQGQVDASIPGIQVAGASLLPGRALADQSAFLRRQLSPDCVVLTYGCACDVQPALDAADMAHCLKWVCGCPCAVCAARNVVHNVYGVPGTPYDSSFYITVAIKSSTFFFVSGRDDFPAVTPARVPMIEARRERACDDNVCFYCGHSNHSKVRCPLIQCAACGAFGHTDRVCPRTHQ